MKIYKQIENALDNFKPYSYSKMFKTLSVLIPSQMVKTKILILVTGPCGSGKSAIITNFYEKGLFSKYQYVNAEVYGKVAYTHINDIEKRKVEASEKIVEICNSLIDNATSFVYETSITNAEQLGVIQKARQNGYNIATLFVSTKDPRVNIERCEKNILEGSFPVSREEIVKSYINSLERKETLKALSFRFFDIDNTKNPIIDKFTADYEHMPPPYVEKKEKGKNEGRN